MFHKSKINLRKWFWAIFLMATSNKSVSALYLQNQLGIGSYRTAWLMMQKIRAAMGQRDVKYQLSGTVEADEIQIGGKQSLKERRELGTNKTPFLIMVEEMPKGGPKFVSFEELESVYEEHVLPALKKHVLAGSKLKADGASSYLKAQQDGYGLDRSVYMTDKEKTQEHLRWINILTSNLKRFLLSTHHGVHPKYRKKYLTEFAYRFNRRHWPAETFDRLLYACVVAKPADLPEIRA
jgi:transposase-like protein